MQHCPTLVPILQFSNTEGYWIAFPSESNSFVSTAAKHVAAPRCLDTQTYNHYTSSKKRWQKRGTCWIKHGQSYTLDTFLFIQSMYVWNFEQRKKEIIKRRFVLVLQQKSINYRISWARKYFHGFMTRPTELGHLHSLKRVIKCKEDGGRTRAAKRRKKKRTRKIEGKRSWKEF